MTEQPIWVMKVTYEKNATDGISYWRSLDALADAVHEAEMCEGMVQVFKCVPVDHEIIHAKIGISGLMYQTQQARGSIK